MGRAIVNNPSSNNQLNKMQYRFTQIRKWFTLKTTVSELFYNGDFNNRICYILEDVCRPDGVKIPKETAIPAGLYHITITPSVRFKRPMPLIYNTEMFIDDFGHSYPNVVSSKKKIWEGIRAHYGNTEADTDGCLLTGTTVNNDKTIVFDSRIAFDNKFFPLLQQAIKESNDNVTYEIINMQL